MTKTVFSEWQTDPLVEHADEGPARRPDAQGPVALLDAGGIQVTRLVVAAGGRARLPAGLRGGGRLLISTNAPLAILSDTAPPLVPCLLAPSITQACNPGPHPALAFVLCADAATTLVAFGSRIRGTHHARSDLDLLAFVRGTQRHEVPLGRVSLTISPRRVFLDQARAGAPFAASVLACHRHLSGPQDVIRRARAQFGRAPALPDPAHLADLVRFCLGRPALEAHRPLALARLRWALRTLLYLEGEDPFGDATALGAQTQHLLDRLAAVNRAVPGAFVELSRAAAQRFAPRARLAEDAPLGAARAHFAATGNLLGLEVVEAADHLSLHRKSRQPETTGAL